MQDLKKDITLNFKKLDVDLYEADGKQMTFKELVLWMKEMALEK